VAVALRLPWAVFALPAGIIADRTDRRRLILNMDLLRSVAFGLAALMLWSVLLLASPQETGFSSAPAFEALLLAAAAPAGRAKAPDHH